MDNAKQVPGTFGFLIAPKPNRAAMLDDLRTIGGSLAGLGRALGIRGGPSGLARRLTGLSVGKDVTGLTVGPTVGFMDER